MQPFVVFICCLVFDFKRLRRSIDDRLDELQRVLDLRPQALQLLSQGPTELELTWASSLKMTDACPMAELGPVNAIAGQHCKTHYFGIATSHLTKRTGLGSPENMCPCRQPGLLSFDSNL